MAKINEQNKLKARNMYVYEYRNLEEIAELLGTVASTTVRAWKEKSAKLGDDWDKARSAHRIAEGGLSAINARLLEELARNSQNIFEKIKELENPLEAVGAIAQLGDSYSKLTRAIRDGTPQLNELAVIQKTLTILRKFIEEKYPQHLTAFVDILEPFAVHMTKQVGNKK
ncbi:DUF1804 family protein [Beggiatoa leptomitoformis]|uniref:DUF1804 family protein n=1 Tax=Beggiatoa leptomitoformis TaxID=288004 RepID=A0A2N9YH79_9GAMM|nr:DUF1804 family protein [Beggiatoa leptomitoformis]ALG67881.1 DUF1804 family protein [Beggiatoa leptomitoformis]AUI69857.1 DUF1804 family protein [Beggiatoa leptomitoformis]